MSDHGSKYAIIGDIMGNHGTVVVLVQQEDQLRPAKQGEQRVRVPLGVDVGDRFRWHREEVLPPPVVVVAPDPVVEASPEPAPAVEAKRRALRRAR